DLSSELNKIQKKRLIEHSKHFKAYNCSICDWKTLDDRECFIIALEVLDNFPHDKIIIDRDQILETRVIQNDHSTHSEIYVPLSDHLIFKYLTITKEIITDELPITSPPSSSSLKEFYYDKIVDI